MAKKTDNNNNRNKKSKRSKKNALACKTELTVGGQAVIEGVMMKSADKYATAVRKPDNKIVIQKKNHISASKKNKFLGLPFVRGVIVLVETMIIGYKSMNYSANQALGEDEGELSTFWEVFMIIFSLLIAIALIKLLPLFLATLFKNKFGGNNIAFNLVDGGAKLLILILYIAGISLMKDVRRVFQYHGAEHKTVACYEDNKELTVNNVKKYSKAHPRCGTTFILVVFLFSIIFYLVIPMGVSFWAKLGFRILLFPLIAGVAYEWIKMASKHPQRLINRIFIFPGLLLQGLTTREPDNKQIEVAIKSLEAVVTVVK